MVGLVVSVAAAIYVVRVAYLELKQAQTETKEHGAEDLVAPESAIEDRMSRVSTDNPNSGVVDTVSINGSLSEVLIR